MSTVEGNHVKRKVVAALAHALLRQDMIVLDTFPCLHAPFTDKMTNTLKDYDISFHVQGIIAMGWRCG